MFVPWRRRRRKPQTEVPARLPRRILFVEALEERALLSADSVRDLPGLACLLRTDQAPVSDMALFSKPDGAVLHISLLSQCSDQPEPRQTRTAKDIPAADDEDKARLREDTNETDTEEDPGSVPVTDEELGLPEIPPESGDNGIAAEDKQDEPTAPETLLPDEPDPQPADPAPSAPSLSRPAAGADGGAFEEPSRLLKAAEFDSTRNGPLTVKMADNAAVIPDKSDPLPPEEHTWEKGQVYTGGDMALESDLFLWEVAPSCAEGATGETTDPPVVWTPLVDAVPVLLRDVSVGAAPSSPTAISASPVFVVQDEMIVFLHQHDDLGEAQLHPVTHSQPPASTLFAWDSRFQPQAAGGTVLLAVTITAVAPAPPLLVTAPLPLEEEPWRWSSAASRELTAGAALPVVHLVSTAAQADDERLPLSVLFAPALVVFTTPRRHQATILLAEHDESIRNELHRHLALQGYMVLPAGTAGETWKHLQTPLLPIDVVLLDVQLPDLSGVDLFQRLRELYPRLPVVFCASGEADLSDLERLRDLGAPHCLHKPVAVDKLLATVKFLLR